MPPYKKGLIIIMIKCEDCKFSVLEEDKKRRCAVNGEYVSDDDECSLSFQERKEILIQVLKMVEEEFENEK